MSVQQRYMAPRLTRHGTVSDITGWRFESEQAHRHEAAALIDGAAPTNYSIDGVLMRLDEEELVSPSHGTA